MDIEQERLPKCIGFIMDGNRRWAKAKNLPALEGHAKGYEVVKALITTMHTEKIPHMVLYAFSTENWKRTEEEVGYIMNLMHYALRELGEMPKKDPRKINLRIIGEIARLSQSLQTEIATIETQNHVEPELTVWVAFSYGGRAEIVQAVNRAIKNGEVMTEKTFAKLLWTDGMPDPDLIIRTSGELRTSNFLIWQAAYSELFFTETLWPDFQETEFQSILVEYGNRQRRKGT